MKKIQAGTGNAYLGDGVEIKVQRAKGGPLEGPFHSGAVRSCPVG